ncbi:hypothetical protein ANCCAN_07406 [Ancylostoma caninum]|uniref:Uncharacterized protein n=1 Tax=Ancylostoma caninum TaxID=29170 RepID=A0A368GQA4_ANCCA|nr:hypothetical protein ANCCAN_07406 [Ancylostoma caninum]
MSYYPNQYPGGGPGYSPYGQQYPHHAPVPYGQPAHVYQPPNCALRYTADHF